MLTSDLDADEEKDRAALDALLNALLKELDLSGKVGLKLLTPLNPFLVLMLTSDLDADEERQSCPWCSIECFIERIRSIWKGRSLVVNPT